MVAVREGFILAEDSTETKFRKLDFVKRHGLVRFWLNAPPNASIKMEIHADNTGSSRLYSLILKPGWNQFPADFRPNDSGQKGEWIRFVNPEDYAVMGYFPK